MRKELKVAVALLVISGGLLILGSTFPYDVSRRWGRFARWDVIEGSVRAFSIVLNPLCLWYAWKGWYRDRVRFARWRAILGAVSATLLTYSWAVAMLHLLPWLIRGPEPWSDVIVVMFPEFLTEAVAQYSIPVGFLFAFFLPADSMLLMIAADIFLVMSRGIAPTPTV